MQNRLGESSSIKLLRSLRVPRSRENFSIASSAKRVLTNVSPHETRHREPLTCTAVCLQQISAKLPFSVTVPTAVSRREQLTLKTIAHAVLPAPNVFTVRLNPFTVLTDARRRRFRPPYIQHTAAPSTQQDPVRENSAIVWKQ